MSQFTVMDLNTLLFNIYILLLYILVEESTTYYQHGAATPQLLYKVEPK